MAEKPELAAEHPELATLANKVPCPLGWTGLAIDRQGPCVLPGEA
jgi:hypothetical protein